MGVQQKFHTSSPSNAVMISSGTGMSYKELRRYLEVLQEQTGPLDVPIEWSIIRTDQISSYSAGKRMGLQIVDAVASSFFYAIRPSAYGFTEDRYVRMLKPVVYNQRRQYLGYGLKFWPREVKNRVEEEQFEWIRNLYQ